MIYRLNTLRWIIYESVMNITPFDTLSVGTILKKGDIVLFEDRHYEIVEKPYFDKKFNTYRLVVRRLITVNIKV